MITIVGTNSDRSAARRRGHGVVSVSNTTNEIDTATRITISPADSRPSAVSPTGVPNHVPNGITMWPGVIRLRVAGSTTMPVKIGTNSHTRATKKRSESRLVQANATAPRYRTMSIEDGVNERGDDDEDEQGDDLDARVEALQQAGLGGGVVGEDRPAHEVRRATQRLGDVAALGPPADATARAQSDLAAQEPVGSEARSRGHRFAHTVARCSASSRV